MNHRRPLQIGLIGALRPVNVQINRRCARRIRCTRVGQTSHIAAVKSRNIVVLDVLSRRAQRIRPTERIGVFNGRQHRFDRSRTDVDDISGHIRSQTGLPRNRRLPGERIHIHRDDLRGWWINLVGHLDGSLVGLVDATCIFGQRHPEGYQALALRHRKRRIGIAHQPRGRCDHRPRTIRKQLFHRISATKTGRWIEVKRTVPTEVNRPWYQSRFQFQKDGAQGVRWARQTAASGIQGSQGVTKPLRRSQQGQVEPRNV